MLAADRQEFMEKWWRERVGGWVSKAERIARQYREACIDEKDWEDHRKLRNRRIFGVVNDAVQYLACCGPEINRLVGVETVAHLLGECRRIAGQRFAVPMCAVIVDLEQYRSKHHVRRPGPRGEGWER